MKKYLNNKNYEILVYLSKRYIDGNGTNSMDVNIYINDLVNGGQVFSDNFSSVYLTKYEFKKQYFNGVRNVEIVRENF